MMMVVYLFLPFSAVRTDDDDDDDDASDVTPHDLLKGTGFVSDGEDDDDNDKSTDNNCSSSESSFSDWYEHHDGPTSAVRSAVG